MRKIHINNQKNGYDVIFPDAQNKSPYAGGYFDQRSINWHQRGQKVYPYFPRNGNYCWSGSFRGKGYDWKKHANKGYKGKYNHKHKKNDHHHNNNSTQEGEKLISGVKNT